MNRPLLIGASAVAGVAVVVVALSTLDDEGPAAKAAAKSPLAAADAACTARQLTEEGGDTVELADGGTTLLIDTNPLEGYNRQYGTLSVTDESADGLLCILGELETPRAIVSQVERTNSLQGVQEAEHDGIAYSWTYHPDSGNEMIITLTDAG